MAPSSPLPQAGGAGGGHALTSHAPAAIVGHASIVVFAEPASPPPDPLPQAGGGDEPLRGDSV